MNTTCIYKGCTQPKAGTGPNSKYCLQHREEVLSAYYAKRQRDRKSTAGTSRKGRVYFDVTNDASFIERRTHDLKWLDKFSGYAASGMPYKEYQRLGMTSNG